MVEPGLPGPTLLYGLLALLQLWVLPGALLVRGFRLARTPVEGVVQSFTLSWLANHLVAVVLVVAGVHHRAAWLAIIAFEVLIGLAWALRALREPLGESLARALEGPVARAVSALRAMDRRSAATAYWTPLAAWALVTAALLPIRYAGTVFRGYDAVLAWNRWAVAWGEGRIPAHTWHYPQLMPTAWSISYVLAGSTDNQLFARVAMAAFPVVLVAMLADLALRRGEPWLLAAGPLAYLALTQSYGSDFLTDGYADMAVACLSFAPLYILVAPALDGDRGTRPTHTIVAGALAAGAAGLCKQSGLAIALLYGPLVFALEPLPLRARLRRGMWAGALALAIASPWYLFVEWRIYAGHDVSEAASVAYVHRTNTPGARLAQAADQLADVFQPLVAAVGIHRDTEDGSARAVLAVLGAVALVGVGKRAARAPLALGLFWGSIWAAYLCYDRRNFALVWTPLALAFAGGGALLARVLPDPSRSALARRIPRRPIAVLVLVLGVALLVTQGFAIAFADGSGPAPISLGPFRVSLRRAEDYPYRVAPWFLAALALYAVRRGASGVGDPGEPNTALTGMARALRGSGLGRVPVVVPLGVLAVAAGLGVLSVPGESIHAYAIERRYELGSSAVNRELARRQLAGELADGAIVTDYGLLGTAPYVGPRARRYRHYLASEFFTQVDSPGARYLLIDDWSLGRGPARDRSPPEVLERIARDQASGALVEVLQLDGHTLFEWVNSPRTDEGR